MMAAAAVDVGYLAASYAIPETTFQSLLTEPTVELVQSLLVQIEAKAREYDDLKSQKLRADVELESAVHNADTRARTLKATVDKAQKEAEELRQKLAQEETARQQVETELQAAQAAAGSTTSELQSLESRIKSLEAQNRDTVALHDAKSAAYDRLAEELSAQHQKFVGLRKQVSELEEKNQSLENAATNVKFREANFQQEIELLRKNNEYFDTELKTRAADHSKFRKEKNAQIAELQRANADANHNIDSLRRTEASQRQRIEELEQKIEQYIVRIQQLQDEAAQIQESSRAELDNARRLAALHQESANTVKKRLQEIQDQLTATSDEAAEEVGRLQAEVESERTKAAEYERRVTELESLVEVLETRLSELRSNPQVPGTPRRTMNGPFDLPGRAGSPAVFSPGGSRLKGAMSTTQLYAENTKLKAEIRAFKEHDEKQKGILDDMLNQLEQCQPQFDQLRQENERLTSEAGDMSALLEEAIAEREAARKEMRKLQGDYQGFLRQKELDRQLMRDATLQCKLVLYQQLASAEGLDSLDEEQRAFLEETVQNAIPDRLLDEDDTATSRLLSKHLVLFKNVSELVEKNQELLRSIRELAETYEGSEAQAKANQQEKDREELAKLRDEIAQYADEIKSLKLRSQSLLKERDMYRRIVTSRGQVPPEADVSSIFRQSVGDRATITPPPANIAPSVEQTPHLREVAGYEKLVKDLQAHVDLLKEESATDRMTLKQQADRLTKENGQLQSENMRLNNKVAMAQERFELQQEKIKALQSEKNELQKRCDSIQDISAKQDLRIQQTAEELAEAKSRVESLGRENANLKASQALWTTIEDRLKEDNKSLNEEKGRLNHLIKEMQTLRNEQELAEAQSRRTLQSRAESLEVELQNAQRKLEEEIREHKQVLQRQEWEQTEKQKKIDDLVKAANEVRQELTSVKSARDHLQVRVNELETELHSAQERALHTPARSAPHLNGPTDTESGLSPEEELTIQFEELQRKFDRAQEELDAANTQIETYKNIAQEAEERLQSYVDAQEQLQEEMNRATAEKDSTIADLKQRVDEISAELATTNSQLSELRGLHEQENLRISQQKELFDAEISRLREDADEYKAAMETEKQLVATQAEIATQAQQDYESELAKHGKTMENLRTLREEYQKIRTEVAQYRAQSEAARASLAEGEEHWALTKERYEGELTEARNRYNDLNEHNKKLLQQFENLNAQIASLKSSRMSVAAGQTDTADLDESTSGLQEIITYLRQEKDILEIQFNMKDQEVKSLSQRLEHTQTKLDQTLEKLNAERIQAQSRQTGADLTTLQETIENLNVYRESNTALRNEKDQLKTRLEEREKEVESLRSQLQPLQSRIRELEGELELSNGRLKILEEDRDRWQKRHQDVLQRYDRIDPKELEDLKSRVEELENERNEAQKDVQAQIQAAKEAQKQVLTNQYKDRVRKQRADADQKYQGLADEFKSLEEKLHTLEKERDDMREQVAEKEQQLSAVRSELESACIARDEAIASANASAEIAMAEEGQVNENMSFSLEEKAALEARVAKVENDYMQAANQATSYHIQFQQLEEKARSLENNIGDLHQQIAGLNTALDQARSEKEQAVARAEALQSRLSNGTVATSEPSEEIEKLKTELAAAQKEVDDLRTSADMAETISGAGNEQAVKPVTEQVAEQVSAQVAEQVAAKRAELNELQETAKKMQADAEHKIAEAERKMTNIKARCNDSIRKLKAEHEAEMEQIRQQLRSVSSQDNEAVPRDAATKESQGPDSAIPIKLELPGAGATDLEIKNFVSNNPVIQNIIKRNVAGQIQKVKAELEKKAENAIPQSMANADTDQQKTIAQQVEEATASARLAYEKVVQTRYAAKESIAKNKFNKLKAQWDIVEQAATETPEKPVREVYEVAKQAKPAPAPPANTPQPTAQASGQAGQAPPQPPTSSVVSTASEAERQQATSSGLSQVNGSRANTLAQPNLPQPAFSQPGVPNAFTQPSHNSFGQQQNSMTQNFGFSGIAQPGFASTPNQQPLLNTNQGRPNSPFAQAHQPQQGGRGRGANAGTAPAVLRDIMGQALGIPRGGASNIPRAGGGRGQQQQQQGQAQNPHTQASQIGRGGGRGGGGRGRGQGQGGPQMNPGAPDFQPGGGRGQKRGAEDDGGGSHRGGKRARGGRGGGGGGGGAGGAEE